MILATDLGGQDASVVLKVVVGEIILSEQVEMPPRLGRVDCDHPEKPVSLLRGSGLLQLTGRVEIIPADDAVAALQPA